MSSTVTNVVIEGQNSGSNYSQFQVGRYDFRDGSYARYAEQSRSRLSYSIKANADELVFVNGSQIGSIAFNDTLAMSAKNMSGSFLTASNSFSFIGSQGKRDIQLSHLHENLDLGQDIFGDNSVYEETVNPDNPVEIISKHPWSLLLPPSLVQFGSSENLNGIIEPLRARSDLDLSTTEIPFATKGIKCSLSIENSFKKSCQFADGYDADDLGTTPFLDAVEFFGTVELPSEFKTDDVTITPFRDTNHYKEIYFDEQIKRGVSVTSDMSNVIKGGSFRTGDAPEYDQFGTTGFDYLNNERNSIVFGGLKK